MEVEMWLYTFHEVFTHLLITVTSLVPQFLDHGPLFTCVFV